MLKTSVRVAILVLAAALGPGLPGAFAQQADPALQGRLLQRSDGAYFIYKDGARYAVELADLGDDDINAIPLANPEQLFAGPSATAPAATPPAAQSAQVQAAPREGSVPVGKGVTLGIPRGYSVLSQTDGEVAIDKNNVSTMTISVKPPQPNSGAILTPAQAELADETGFTIIWKPIQEVPPHGKATQITAAPFTATRLVTSVFEDFHGGVFAIARPDTAIVLTFISRGAEDETAAIETAVESLLE